MNRIIKWIKILRPGTLFAGFSPVGVGLIIVAKQQSINWFTAVMTLLCAMGIQVLSNLVNDYYDFKKGLDKSGRVGFKRALAEGDVTVLQMKNAIFIDLVLILSIGAFLIWRGGWVILLIGLFSIFFAWLYSATKKSLSYLGIADVFVLIFFGPIAVEGTIYLQLSSFNIEGLYLGLVCGAISACVLIVNNIRDINTDKVAHKQSFVVRFGKKAGEYEFLFFIVLAVLCSIIPNPFTFSNLIFIPAIYVYSKLLKASEHRYNKVLIQTGLLNVVFLFLYSVDFLLKNI
ncbi:MAG: 1,4-dihydroxy-2-naphthoate octaprenyltransferase [Paludibacteraceae bacterium]